MADLLAGELERYYQSSGAPAESELVFPGPKSGGPLDKSSALRRMRHALRAARLDERHRFHDLRHTFGTAMAAAGVPMRTLDLRRVEELRPPSDAICTIHDGL